MKILVTGSNGFLGKNLILKLRENEYADILLYNKSKTLKTLNEFIKKCDVIFHLAGLNRSDDIKKFNQINFELTKYICDKAALTNRHIPIVYSSSIQSSKKNYYGISKKKAEKYLLRYSKISNSKVYIYKLPNIFGKWSKPNYNSVISTFCHNVANNKPIIIFDKSEILSLIHVDDVIEAFLKLLRKNKKTSGYQKINKTHNVNILKIVNILEYFKDSNMNLDASTKYESFKAKLYSTYCSYLPKKSFSYTLKNNSDNRGNFIEFTKNSLGQHSYFTAYPKVTRGGHYHHRKVEKFLVLDGQAEFKFKHIISNKIINIQVKAKDNRVVLSIPGWAHTITNTGKNNMIVLLWANEVYNKNKPDTYIHEV